jgi:ribose-phosphate pyrophosphokinase
MEKGAKSVKCIATHGVLSGKAFENLENSVMDEVLVSDSIAYNTVRPLPSKLKYISCDKIIAKSIWGLINKKSIHELNEI